MHTIVDVEAISHRPSFNIGGNSEIYAIRHTDILNNPRIVDGQISDDLLIINDWVRIEVLPYSIKYSESESDRDPGTSVQVSVEFVIAQETADLKAKLKLLRQERLALLVKDQSTELSRLIGNRNEYVKHSRKFNTGGLPTELNANRISLAGKLIEVPFFKGNSNVVGPPSAPTNLQALVFSETENRITWTDNSDDETGFEIWRSGDGVNWQLIGEVAENVTEFIDDISQES